MKWPFQLSCCQTNLMSAKAECPRGVWQILFNSLETLPIKLFQKEAGFGGYVPA